MSLYAVVVGEPMREECVGDPKGTYMHTLKERYALADQCGSRTLGFKPLILEHAGGELTPGTEHFPVPNNSHVGRLIDTFVRADGQLYHTIEIFHEHPKLAALIEDDIKNGRPWGVSLGKDLWLTPNQRDIISKDITHIGLTRTPLHGDAKHGATWMTLVSKTIHGLYSNLKTMLEKETDFYIPEGTKERWAEMFEAVVAPKEQTVPVEHMIETATTDASAVALEPGESVASPLPDSPEMTTPNIPAGLPPTTNAILAAPSQQDLFVTPAVNSNRGMEINVNGNSNAAPITSLATALNGGNGATMDHRLARFEPWLAGVSELSRKIFPNPGDSNAHPKPDGDYYQLAAKLKRDFAEITDGVNFSAWPKNTIAAVTLLDDYMDHTKTAAHDFINKVYEGRPAEHATVAHAAIDNPLLRENMPVAQSVFANYSHGLKNADHWQEQFKQGREAQISLEAKLQQSKDMWEKEKKDWEAREKTLAAELETAKKARTEVTQAALTSVVPVAGQSSFISQISQLPAGNNSFYNNTPPQLYAQQQQPVLQSVGASSTPTELNLPKGWSIAQRSEKQKEIAAGWGVNSLPAHRENTASGLTISRFSDIESMRANAKRFQ